MARAVHAPAAAEASEAATSPRDASIREQAQTELGAEVAATLPQIPPAETLEPIDPGAARIIKSIAAALTDRAGAGSAESITISLSPIRNLSRIGSAEFSAFTERLSEVLTRAGREQRMVFIDEESPLAHYRVLGSAYLVTADGFDWWEMYLSLSLGDYDWQVWDARGPIRVLRTPRAGQAQITTVVR